jgi:ATP phosphoribosyltransferase
MTAKAKPITVALPKGRMFTSLLAQLGQAGLIVKEYERSYRPKANDPRLELKILKPQNIPALVELGRHDLGFTGFDWIAESGCKVETLDDLELEPVDIVAAAAEGWAPPKPGAAPLVVASEYENLSCRFLEKKGWPFRFLRSYGATEVFPPEDADLIIDNSATGQTLRENGLVIVEKLMSSSTRFIGSAVSLKRPEVRQFAEDLVLLMRGVRAAASRVMLEMNVANGNLNEVIRLLPAMKSPTVSQLADGSHVLKAAVPQSEVPRLVPRLKQLGASDILEYPIRKVIP